MREEALDRADALYHPTRSESRLAVALLASHLPFVVLHLANLWKYRPHYQFFPLVLAVFAWLLWQRWPRGNVEHTRTSRWIAWLLLSTGTLCLAAAVVLFSPWGAAVAFVLTAGGVLVCLFGRAALTELAPVWLLLWTIIPPPWRLDGDFIRGLQRNVSRGTSTLLDWLQIDHVLAGNVFELPDRELFVAEACSGVNSQLVLIVISVVLAIVFRRSFLHAVLLVGASIFWSTTVNIGRVLLIVVAAAQWDVNLSDGWQHQLLGFGLAAAGMCLLLSTDRLLVGMFGPVFEYGCESDGIAPDRLPLATDPLSRLWNRVVARASSASSSTVSEGEPATDSGPSEAPSSPDNSDDARVMVRPTNCLTRPLPLVVCCGVLGVLQLVTLVVPKTPEVNGELLADRIETDWLPEQIEGWQCVDFETQQREASSDEGMYSKVWTFRDDDRSLHISVDFPFVGWHELTRCYNATGWTVTERAVQRDTDTSPYVQVAMTKPNGAGGYLLFSAFDGAMSPVQPRSTHWYGVREKLARSPLLVLMGVADQSVSPELTTIQIQLFMPTAYQLDEQQRLEARDVYLRLRRELVGRLAKQATGE